MLENALNGYSGFVGSTLLRQADFAGRFRSTNIAEMDERAWGTVVCAAASAAKWIANRDPAADRVGVTRLGATWRDQRSYAERWLSAVWP